MAELAGRIVLSPEEGAGTGKMTALSSRARISQPSV